MTVMTIVTTPIHSPGPGATGATGAAPPATPAAAPDSLPPPTPGAGGDSLAEIVALLTDELRQDKAQAREARRNAHDASLRAGRARVTQLHRAADERYDAAWTRGLCEIGAGALGVAAGGTGLAGIDAKTGAVGASHEQWSGILSSGGKGLGGAGELLAAGDEADAAHAEANAAARDLEAKGHAHARDEHGEQVEEAQRLLRRVTELEGGIRDAKAQAERAAVYLRG